ncbi:hypothetical protein BDZ97DRAFT_1757253 [Flammula alnicola]|nr:hypothetical protein BDZ97DRAFT_1757253 [Flammula alnicola]
MFFRSLSLFVAVGCAALSSAAPIVPGVGAVGSTLGGLGSSLPPLPVVGSVVPKVESLASNPAGVVGTVTSLTPRLVNGHPSLPEIFKDMCDKIRPITESLTAAVSVKADIKVDVITTLLNQVVDILSDAVVEVQFIVDNPTGFVLNVGETILSIDQVALVVSTLLCLLFTVLKVVVAAVDGAAATVILPLVATIGAHVAQILGLAFQIVPGLLALVVPILSQLVSTIYYLRLAEVVAILGLPAIA